MNRECCGDYYTLKDVRYFRCIGEMEDGLNRNFLAENLKDGDPCPGCMRPVVGRERGQVPVRTVNTTTTVMDEPWVEHITRIDIKTPTWGWVEFETNTYVLKRI